MQPTAVLKWCRIVARCVGLVLSKSWAHHARVCGWELPATKCASDVAFFLLCHCTGRPSAFSVPVHGGGCGVRGRLQTRWPCSVQNLGLGLTVVGFALTQKGLRTSLMPPSSARAFCVSHAGREQLVQPMTVNKWCRIVARLAGLVLPNSWAHHARVCGLGTA